MARLCPLLHGLNRFRNQQTFDGDCLGHSLLDDCSWQEKQCEEPNVSRPRSIEEDPHIDGPPLQASSELEKEMKDPVPVMDNVKTVADAGEDVGSVTKAFKNMVENETEKKLQALESFKQKLLEEKE